MTMRCPKCGGEVYRKPSTKEIVCLNCGVVGWDTDNFKENKEDKPSYCG